MHRDFIANYFADELTNDDTENTISNMLLGIDFLIISIKLKDSIWQALLGYVQ